MCAVDAKISLNANNRLWWYNTKNLAHTVGHFQPHDGFSPAHGAAHMCVKVNLRDYRYIAGPLLTINTYVCVCFIVWVFDNILIGPAQFTAFLFGIQIIHADIGLFIQTPTFTLDSANERLWWSYSPASQSPNWINTAKVGRCVYVCCFLRFVFGRPDHDEIIADHFL